MYPSESEIAELKLSKEDVTEYNCAQRIHQNNVEFLACYFPVMIVAGLAFPMETAYAGSVVLAGRMATAIGYTKDASKRVWGAWFHIGEVYTTFLCGKLAYQLITDVPNNN